jgi:hypothetical protein
LKTSSNADAQTQFMGQHQSLGYWEQNLIVQLTGVMAIAWLFNCYDASDCLLALQLCS